jgi:thioredoxin 1
MVKEIDISSFKSEVVNSNELTIVDFFANWCGPCRKLSPILEEVEHELAGRVKFTKINTDENIDAAREYQVSGLPTLLVFKDGQVVERMVGLMPKSSIITNIEKHL